MKLFLIKTACRAEKRDKIAGHPCFYCDDWGSAAYHLEKDRELLDQIRHNKKLVARRLKCNQYLVYFQSYTNTLDKVKILQQRFETALSEDYVGSYEY